MSILLHFVLIALGGCVLGSLAGALLGTAVWIHRLPPEQWHWMQQAELERRRESEAFREAWWSGSHSSGCIGKPVLLFDKF